MSNLEVFFLDKLYYSNNWPYKVQVSDRWVNVLTAAITEKQTKSLRKNAKVCCYISSQIHIIIYHVCRCTIYMKN